MSAEESTASSPQEQGQEDAGPPKMTRRRVLGIFSSAFSLAGWTAFVGTSASGAAALVRLFFPNVLYEPASSFIIGRPEDYAPGMVDERWKENRRIWVVRRDDGGLYVVLARCTHLGCTPNWLPGENKFKCPCHGSGFRRNGMNFEGPAPRPLDRLKVSLAPDGQLLVDSNAVYQGATGVDPDEQYPESVLVV